MWVCLFGLVFACSPSLHRLWQCSSFQENSWCFSTRYGLVGTYSWLHQQSGRDSDFQGARSTWVSYSDLRVRWGDPLIPASLKAVQTQGSESLLMKRSWWKMLLFIFIPIAVICSQQLLFGASRTVVRAASHDIRKQEKVQECSKWILSTVNYSQPPGQGGCSSRTLTGFTVYIPWRLAIHSPPMCADPLQTERERKGGPQFLETSRL